VNYGRLPLSFEPNLGQTSTKVQWLARGPEYTLYLAGSDAVLQMNRITPAKRESAHPNERQPSISSSAVRMNLLGASSGQKAAGEEIQSGKANYFTGNDPAKWQRDVPMYGKVRMKGVYPGVDLVYYGHQGALEYDFVVAPGADASAIKLSFDGSKAALAANGDLVLPVDGGPELRFNKPVVYQTIDGRRQSVDGRFLVAGNTVGFALGAYDRSAPLVIDPMLSYSTYLGGTGPDRANAIALDASGNAYVTGYTFSADFPLSGSPYQATNFNTANGEVFVTKLNATGTALVYSTFLGGDGGCGHAEVAETFGDVGTAITVDGSGEAFVVGIACSANFPVTAGAFQTTDKEPGRTNGFVTKLSADGGSLMYSTYLGGSGGGSNPGDGDMAQGVAVDSSGNAYVAGQAFSHDYPTTPGAFQTTTYACCNTAFVTKINPAGSALVYSTFVGNENSDAAFAIAIDPAGDAYITGYTIEGSFPVTSNAFQRNDPGGADNVTNAFVTEINPSGSGLLYSTFLGGSGITWPAGDAGYGIVVDALGNAYVTGQTQSHDFPVSRGAFQTANQVPVGGGATGFASKVNTVSGALVYSTYLGGSQSGVANALAVDSSGNLYVAGETYAADFPVTQGSYQSTNHALANGTANAFLTELNPQGTQLVYSTYLGGSGAPSGSDCGSNLGSNNANTDGDGAYGIALGSQGAIYLVGATCSADFPTTGGAFQPSTGATASSNAFVTQFNSLTATTTALTASANPQTAGLSVTFTADVTVTGSSQPAMGTVVFSVDGTAVASDPLTNAGSASYSTASLPVGPHTIVASYSGSQPLLPSTATLIETIQRPTNGETMTTLSTDVNPQYRGQWVTFTATVAALDASTLPTGNVVFSVDGHAVPTVALYEGDATWTTSSLTPGTHVIEAYYQGGGGFTSSSSVLKEKILPPETGMPSAPSPMYLPVAGKYTGSVTVTLSDSVPGAKIYYTVGGSAPALYMGPITIPAGYTTVDAFASAAGYDPSAVAQASYSVIAQAPTPVFTPGPGTYAPGQEVAISDANPAATIRYTTDGSTPTNKSHLYTRTLMLSGTETIRAIAIASGDAASPVSSATYTPK